MWTTISLMQKLEASGEGGMDGWMHWIGTNLYLAFYNSENMQI